MHSAHLAPSENLRLLPPPAARSAGWAQALSKACLRTQPELGPGRRDQAKRELGRPTHSLVDALPNMLGSSKQALEMFLFEHDVFFSRREP